MSARNGREYVEGLRDGRQVYARGELITDVTRHPAFSGIIGTLANLFDMQHRPGSREVLTHLSPISGEQISSSFIIPRNWDDMERRVAAERLRCETTYGLMGRLPDFMNALVTDMAAVRDKLAARNASLAENAWRYYLECGKRDYCLTHVLVDPQIDRTKGPEAQRSVRAVRETDKGLVVSGARMLSTLAPISDELWVGPYMPRRKGEEDFALSFAIPVATRGLKFICREPYDTGRTMYDRPLSGRFDEGDALAIFEDVLVPWERVFINRDVEMYNSLMPLMPGLSPLQAVVRSASKLRFLTGVACSVAHVAGRSGNGRYQEMLGELIAAVEIAAGLVTATAREVMAKLERMANNPESLNSASQVLFEGAPLGITAIRYFFPQAIANAINAIRMIGSSGLVMTPAEADFDNPDENAALSEFMPGKDLPARERVEMMKLAWDATSTEFAGRQMLYEWFYVGDPIISRMTQYNSPARDECEAMVRRLLGTLAKPQ